MASERAWFVERGRRLEYFTILWNSLEAVAALISGLTAGSVALVGFGLNSFVEVARIMAFVNGPLGWIVAAVLLIWLAVR